MKLPQNSKAAVLSKCYKRSLEETDAKYEITPWFTHLCSLTDSTSTGPALTNTDNTELKCYSSVQKTYRFYLQCR